MFRVYSVLVRLSRKKLKFFFCLGSIGFLVTYEGFQVFVFIFKLLIHWMANHCFVRHHQQSRFVFDAIHISHNVVPVSGGNTKAFSSWDMADVPPSTVSFAATFQYLFMLIKIAMNGEWIHGNATNVFIQYRTIVFPYSNSDGVLPCRLFHVVSMSVGDVSSVIHFKGFVKKINKLFFSFRL